MTNIHYARIESGWLKWANLKAFREYLATVEGKDLIVTFERETGVRSGNQNRAIHLYFEHLAQELNDAGFNCKFILGEKTVELDWSPSLIKEMIWRPIQLALTGKDSTTKLDKVTEIDKVYEHLNRFFSNEPFCLSVPFPNDNREPAKIERPTEDSNEMLNNQQF